MDLRPFLYGGVSSVLAELCTFPFDTTKTRLQIQGELINNHTIKHFKGGKYNGMLHALKVISKQEGLSALYRGLNAALIRQASYGTLKIGLYQKMKSRLAKKSQGETLASNIFCAVVAGVTSSAIANPTDIIKIRLQARTNYDAQNSGFFRELSTTFSKEGLPGLYKAVFSTAARAALLVGVLLPSYDLTKQTLVSRRLLPDNACCHLASSLLAATAATAASCPIEVIRTRLMNRSLLSAGSTTPPPQTFAQCLCSTVRHERPAALWKGFVPTWFRIGPWNVVFFLCFEQIQHADRLFFG